LKQNKKPTCVSQENTLSALGCVRRLAHVSLILLLCFTTLLSIRILIARIGNKGVSGSMCILCKPRPVNLPALPRSRCLTATQTRKLLMLCLLTNKSPFINSSRSLLIHMLSFWVDQFLLLYLDAEFYRFIGDRGLSHRRPT